MSEIQYQRVEGKTYTLFGQSVSTVDYYSLIKALADRIIIKNDIKSVLDVIRKYSSYKRYLKRLLKADKTRSLISVCLKTINEELKPYTAKTADHLKNLPVSKLWDRRLATTEEQYHLYMLEIELTNRLNRDAFLDANRKISLQPYCLQDFSADCKAADTGFDYQCKHCSKNCFQNHASRMLKEYNVEPYIWMGASIGEALKESKRGNSTLGILGIACIPELVSGMRKCVKYGIPVMGLPLNANRCTRWFGEFHQNSIDLSQLDNMLREY